MYALTKVFNYKHAKNKILSSIVLSWSNQSAIAYGTENSEIIIIDLSGEKQAEYKLKSGAISALFHLELNGKNFIVAGSENDTITVQPDSGEAFELKGGHNSDVTCFTSVVHNNLIHFVSGGYDGSILVWDPITWKTINRIKSGCQIMSLVGSIINGKQVILSGELDGTIKIYDVCGDLVVKFQAHTESVLTLRVIRRNDNLVVLTGGMDGYVKTFSTDGTLLAEYSAHSDFVRSVLDFDQNGKLVLISGEESGTLRVWDVDSKSLITSAQGHESAIKNLRSVVFKGNASVVSVCKSEINIWN